MFILHDSFDNVLISDLKSPKKYSTKSKNKTARLRRANLMKIILPGNNFNDFLMNTIKPIMHPNRPTNVIDITKNRLKMIFIFHSI